MDVSIIRAKCTERGITIAQLEKTLHLGNGMIAKWEGSVYGPSVKNIKKVADYFGVTVDELLREDETR